MIDREHLNGIAVNIELTDHNPDALLERFSALREASHAIATAYIEQLQQAEPSEEITLPSYFDEAVNYATNLIYEAGSPMFNDDITREMKNDSERKKHKGSDDWRPSDDEQNQLAHALIHLGSLLSVEDKEPAFVSNVSGRMHEALDPYDTTYNKFGEIVYSTDFPPKQ